MKLSQQKLSKNVMFNMPSTNYESYNYLISIRISSAFIKFSIYLVKLFSFLNSNNSIHRKTYVQILSIDFSAKQGDLQMILDCEGYLNECQARNVTQQVLQGISYLHENKVVHLDIKVIRLYFFVFINYKFRYLATKYSSHGKMAKYSNKTL